MEEIKHDYIEYDNECCVCYEFFDESINVQDVHFCVVQSVLTVVFYFVDINRYMI